MKAAVCAASGTLCWRSAARRWAAGSPFMARTTLSSVAAPSASAEIGVARLLRLLFATKSASTQILRRAWLRHRVWATGAGTKQTAKGTTA